MLARQLRGMTLIELLVVIFIIMAVTALAIPVFAPAMRGRKVREASRIVTAYLAGARSEALKTGRPVGVVFEQLPDSPEWCFSLSQCKEPLPYMGDFSGAEVRFSIVAGCNRVQPVGTVWLDPSDPLARVHPGDQIQFNHQGHSYTLAHNATDGWHIGEQLPSGEWNMFSATATHPREPVFRQQPPPLSPVECNATYRIRRQPIRTSTAAVQLPPGIVIDLNYSGDGNPLVVRDQSSGDFDDTPYESDPYVGEVVSPTGSIAVMFAPDGSVTTLYRHDSTGAIEATTPIGPIHFLLGERERVPVTSVETLAGIQSIEGDAEAQLEAFNFMDLDLFWVTLNPRSGKLDSTENAVATPIANPPATPVVGPIADAVRQSRAFAFEVQSVSGS